MSLSVLHATCKGCTVLVISMVPVFWYCCCLVCMFEWWNNVFFDYSWCLCGLINCNLTKCMKFDAAFKNVYMLACGVAVIVHHIQQGMHNTSSFSRMYSASNVLVYSTRKGCTVLVMSLSVLHATCKVCIVIVISMVIVFWYCWCLVCMFEFCITCNLQGMHSNSNFNGDSLLVLLLFSVYVWMME